MVEVTVGNWKNLRRANVASLRYGLATSERYCRLDQGRPVKSREARVETFTLLDLLNLSPCRPHLPSPSQATNGMVNDSTKPLPPLPPPPTRSRTRINLHQTKD